jgi:hypothetical protein
MPMSEDKITISWQELRSSAVDASMEQRAAAVVVREHYDRQLAREPDPFTAGRLASWRYNPIFYTALFGLLGALIGWGVAQPIYRADPAAQARELSIGAGGALSLYNAGRISPEEAQASLAAIRHAGQSNPYFRILQDESLSPQRRQVLLNRQQWIQFIRDALFYGICGMIIAAAMATAESIIGRNYAGAVIYGSAGAVAGLLGGIAASLFIQKVGGAVMKVDWMQGSYRPIAARAATWAILGLFLALGPALVLRSAKRLIIGLVGGLVGGLIGGLLYQPIVRWSGSDNLAILAALVAVGLLSGMATGMIENAAKGGWLKVTRGLIAGKQFILYRNPTYIGSAANCEIYLFKDRRIGRRHAAIRQVPGGFELENLPLGEETFVNDRAIARTRPFNGDRIRIGGTEFSFQEKESIE